MQIHAHSLRGTPFATLALCRKVLRLPLARLQLENDISEDTTTPLDHDEDLHELADTHSDCANTEHGRVA